MSATPIDRIRSLIRNNSLEFYGRTGFSNRMKSIYEDDVTVDLSDTSNDASNFSETRRDTSVAAMMRACLDLQIYRLGRSQTSESGDGDV